MGIGWPVRRDWARVGLRKTFRVVAGATASATKEGEGYDVDNRADEGDIVAIRGGTLADNIAVLSWHVLAFRWNSEWVPPAGRAISDSGESGKAA
jgi:hypothetical protein